LEEELGGTRTELGGTRAELEEEEARLSQLPLLLLLLLYLAGPM